MLWLVAIGASAFAPSSQGPLDIAIRTADGGHQLLDLAAAELRRYAILTTSDIAQWPHAEPALRIELVVAPARSAWCNESEWAGELAQQQHYIRHCDSPGTFELAGGDAAGALYAAYTFIEEVLGVGFSIHGDRLPTSRRSIAAVLAAYPAGTAGDLASPRFTKRGLFPFHDNREGPDFWSNDDYAAFIGNMLAPLA